MNELTYGRLDTLLRSLGFSASLYEEDTRVYKHAKTGALVTFPLHPDRELVRPHHVAGTRMILDAFGIAIPPELAAQLQAG
jgi:predicted RNA binding protein YcfA (HicA-like mRNA interferase family)